MQPLDDVTRARLAQFDVLTAEWQLAAVRLPGWVRPEGREPYRLIATIARGPEIDDLGRGDVMRCTSLLEGGLALALLNLAERPDVDYLPSLILMRDAKVFAQLSASLGPLGIEVRLEQSLPLIEAFEANVRRETPDPLAEYSLLAGSDVSIARLRGFAEAAAEFARAEPWQHLWAQDLMFVESGAPLGMEHVQVLGGTVGPQGLGFHSSELEFNRMLKWDARREYYPLRTQWMFHLSQAHEIPERDVDLWDGQNLPLASRRAYPSLRGHTPERDALPPDGDRLDFCEAVLRVMAAVTEDELDGGRWTRTVRCSSGERTLTMQLPTVLATPVAMPVRQSKELRSKAADFLVDMASRAWGRNKMRFARMALKLDPHSVEAWNTLMGAMYQPHHQLKFAVGALEAAEHHVGADRLARNLEPHLADPVVITYLKMRWAVSDIQWAIRERDAALAHHRAILDLAPSDPLGIRVDLIARLIREDKADVAFDVVGELENPMSALEAYASALVTFAMIGDCEESRNDLRFALRMNRHAAKYLSPSARTWLPRKEDIGPGNAAEGMMIQDRLDEAWLHVEGSYEWLRKVRGARRSK